VISVAGPFQVDNGLGAHGIKADGWNAEDSRGGCKRHLRHARDNPRINPKHFEDWTEFLDLLDKELALPGYNDNLPHIPACIRKDSQERRSTPLTSEVRLTWHYFVLLLSTYTTEDMLGSTSPSSKF